MTNNKSETIELALPKFDSDETAKGFDDYGKDFQYP
jgi:hypothetical protein